MFRKMPFLLLTIIIGASLTHTWLPLPLKSGFYALSLTLKSVIVFALPFLIFGLLFKTAVQLSKQASKWILFLLIAICASNFLSTWLSFGVGKFIYGFDLSMTFPEEALSLMPAWEFSLPKWVGNDVAMFSGLILGVLLGWRYPSFSEAVGSQLEKVVGLVLKGFLYVIPLFILGFVVKMNHDQVMIYILRNYGMIFCMIACSVFAYVSFLYLAASRFQGSVFIQKIKNMMPAAIAGFGSMSSAAAMPLTILGTEKNAKNPDFARAIIPATVNVHLIGDCFAIPIFAFAVLKSFGVADPSVMEYLIFAAYFVLAKFSVAAVPGGGILVMIPVLESYLHFDPAMLSLITALYILFDPVITAANVFGNGGFALVLDRLVTSPKKVAVQG